MMSPSHIPIDIRGQRFGKWLVVDQVYEKMSGRNRHLAKCRCECGAEKLITPTALRLGQSTRCRTCSNREKANLKSRLTHGGTHSRLYNIWGMMKARCERPSSEDYHRYGGRGIRVCPEWHDFAVFRGWALSKGYRDDLTIDRRDNDKGYEPGNCHWIPRPLQNRNRRDNRRYEWRGRRLLLPEIAEQTGIPTSTLRQRIIRDGWSVERAATQPRRQGDFTRKSLLEKKK